MTETLLWLRELDREAFDMLVNPAPLPPIEGLLPPRAQRWTRRRLIASVATIPIPAGAVRCVSVLSPVAWAAFAQTGKLAPREQHTESVWRGPYDWMRWRMLRMLEGYTGGFPVWLWPAECRRAWSPVREWASRGDVAVVVDVPRDKLLVSDFDEWHSVLNGWAAQPTDCPVCGGLLCLEHEPDDGEELTVSGDRPWTVDDAATIERVTVGWDGMFDARRHATRIVQATTEQLLGEWVVAAFKRQ